MEQMVAMEIPRAWLEGIADEPLTLQEIFRKGLYQYKVERAFASIARRWFARLPG